MAYFFTLLLQSKTQNIYKLNQSEYSLKPIHFIQARPIRIFCSLVAEKHFKTMVTCDSRLVSLSMFQRPCLQLFGRFRLPLTCLHLLSRDPSMNDWLSPTACTCRPVFVNKPHLWEQAFLLDLTRHLSLHTAFLPDH